MKTALRIGFGIAVAITLVIVGLSVGWSLWGRSLWAAGPFTMPGMGTGGGRLEGCGGWGGWQGGMGVLAEKNIRSTPDHNFPALR